jgi:predicted kinase
MNKDTTFTMLVGLPASGKSTFAESIKDRYSVFSSDALREELFGDANDQTHNEEVFNELHRRIDASLKDHKSCVYDATNLSRKRRKAFLRTIQKYDYVSVIAVVFATDVKTCLLRNSQRDRVVPDDVIWKFYKNLTIPRLEEGFDVIRIIPSKDKKYSLDDYIRRMFNFDQDNPHHTLTLDNHCMLASANVEHDEIRLATLIHDIGKPDCKTYMKRNGVKDDHAHYYNHAEVGAYLYACSVSHELALWKEYGTFVTSKTNKDIMNMLLIQYHMDFYGLPKDDNGDVQINGFLEKLSKIYGNTFSEYLKELHIADMMAH